jgi:hypothetical protein
MILPKISTEIIYQSEELALIITAHALLMRCKSRNAVMTANASADSKCVIRCSCLVGKLNDNVIVLLLVGGLWGANARADKLMLGLGQKKSERKLK